MKIDVTDKVPFTVYGKSANVESIIYDDESNVYTISGRFEQKRITIGLRKLCYLSGKISGLLHIEYCANFDYASIEAEKLGYIPVNPVRIYNGKDWCWLRFMIADLALLARCDAIYLQKNWLDSSGAKIERAFARMLRKEVVYQ
jgi:hypothetical protein